MSIGNQNILRSEFGISEQSWTELRRHRITELPNIHKFSKASFYRVLQLVMFFFFPDSTLRVCAKKIISEKDLIWCLFEIRESSSGILFPKTSLFFLKPKLDVHTWDKQSKSFSHSSKSLQGSQFPPPQSTSVSLPSSSPSKHGMQVVDGCSKFCATLPSIRSQLPQFLTVAESYTSAMHVGV